MNTDKPNIAPYTGTEVLSDQQLARYRDQGFLYIPQVLSPAEVAQYLAEARAMFARHKLVSWDESDGNVMDWVADAEMQSAVMRKLVLHPSITGIAERLAGHDLRLLKSELLLKRSQGATGTPAHIDDFAFPVKDARSTLTVWVALVDVPVEMGCMSFVAGSHHQVRAAMNRPVPDDSEPSPFEGMMDPFGMCPELRWMAQVTHPLKAGDCTVHDSCTVHWAGSNETGQPRYSLATVYTDAEARFDSDKFTGYDENSEDMEDYQAANWRGMKSDQPLPDDRFPLAGGKRGQIYF